MERWLWRGAAFALGAWAVYVVVTDTALAVEAVLWAVGGLIVAALITRRTYLPGGPKGSA